MAFQLVVLAGALAADPCRSVKVEADAFGGTNAKATFHLINLAAPYELGLHYESGEKTMRLRSKELGVVDGPVPAGTEVLFSLEDGSVVSLTTRTDLATKPIAEGGTASTYVTFNLAVTDEALAQFAGSPVVAVRFPDLAKGTTRDWAPPNRVGKKLQPAATCFIDLE